jgi:hypothetical protein
LMFAVARAFNAGFVNVRAEARFVIVRPQCTEAVNPLYDQR